MICVPEAELREDLPAAQSVSPARLGEDSVALTATWVDQLTNPPTPASSMGNEGKEYPKWIKVHFSHKAGTVGSIPCNPRESWCCHDCRSRQQKQTLHLLEEEWWDLGDVSGSDPSEGSPELMLLSKEDKSAKLKDWPLGFQDIARWLTTRGSPERKRDSPETSVVPLVEPTVATVVSTTMG